MLWVVLSVLYSLDPRDCYTNLPKLVEKCIGDYIVITPDFVGYPSTPVLDWTNIPGDGRHKVHQNGTLVIMGAQVEDSELYSYLVHSEDEFTLTFFNLSVTDCGNMVQPTTPGHSTVSHTRDFVSITTTPRDLVSVTSTTQQVPKTTGTETEKLPTTSFSLEPRTSELPSTREGLVSSVTSDLPESSPAIDSSLSTEMLFITSSKFVETSDATEDPVTMPIVTSSTTPAGGIDDLSGNQRVPLFWGVLFGFLFYASCPLFAFFVLPSCELSSFEVAHVINFKAYPIQFLRTFILITSSWILRHIDNNIY